MMASFYLISSILLVIAWAISNPDDALAVILALRRQFRQSIHQRAGKQAAQELAQKLRIEARQMGIHPIIVDEVIRDNQKVIIDRLGYKYLREWIDD